MTREKINKEDPFMKGFNSAKNKSLEILYDVEDEFWGDRSGYNVIMRAQMEFAKELRKRLCNLSRE